MPERKGAAAKAAKPTGSRYGGKVHGPVVPGAEARPIVGQVKRVKKPYKRKPKPKDEAEASERYVAQQMGGGASSHALKVKRAFELKRLLDPLTPSLIQVMSDIAHDKKVHPAVRLDAADRLLNRLYGKPTEKVEISDPDEDIPGDEVKTMLNRILESVGAPMLEFHDDPEQPDDQQEAA